VISWPSEISKWEKLRGFDFFLFADGWQFNKVALW